MNSFLKIMQSSKAAKALILATVLAAVPQAVRAGESTTSAAMQTMKIVPSLGYSYFNIQGSSVDYKSKSGNSAAVLVEIPTGGALEIESGLEYLETGAKQSIDFGFLSLDTATLDVKQLAVPIRAKYTFNPAASGAHYFGKAGVTPTYVMSAKVDAEGTSTDVKSDMNALGAFAQAGLGADWGLDAVTGRITADFTYSYGLTKAFKNDDGKAAGFQINLGYAFLL